MRGRSTVRDAAAFVDRAPAFLRRWAYSIARGEGPLGRWADAARFRFSADQVPDVPHHSEARVRLLIGPANSAGQGYQWARAVERGMPYTDAVSLRGIGENAFAAPVDLQVPVAVYQRSDTWHERFEEYLSHRTHVVWESGQPLLGRRYRSDVAREMDVMRERQVDGALLFHGSDIRPPSRHAALSPWSPFRHPTGAAFALEAEAARNTALAAQSESTVFVSTPDQLRWLPDAVWLPVVVDPAQWRVGSPESTPAARPVVVHAPSQKWLKGTDLIEPMLRRLAAEGVIEYRQLIGVPHASMPTFYAQADIVLDQFVLGIYGVAACEAMAAGRLVISHVDEFTRGQVRDRTGLELPVHEATLETLEGELRRAASAPAAFAEIRSAGPAFVHAVHDGRRSAAALAPFLRVSE